MPNKIFKNNSQNFSKNNYQGTFLKVKHNKTLQHQKAETCLIIILKSMKKKNL